MHVTADRLHQLFLLNLALQLFDGVATYHGIVHWGEGNPIVARLMQSVGIGVALLLLKAHACGCLVVLRRLGPRPIAYETMVMVATVYGMLSFVPWMTRFLSLLPV